MNRKKYATCFDESLLDIAHPSTCCRFPISFLFLSVLHFFENYGWFILVGSFLAMYLLTKLKPFIDKWKNQLQDYSSKKTDGELFPR